MIKKVLTIFAISAFPFLILAAGPTGSRLDQYNNPINGYQAKYALSSPSAAELIKGDFHSDKIILPPLRLPVVAPTQAPPGYIYQGKEGVGGLLNWSRIILRLVFPLIVSIAIVWFVYNVFRYMIAGDEEQKAKAKTDIVWGVVAIFVMMSVWGLVNVLGSTFKLTNSVINAPDLNIR